MSYEQRIIQGGSVALAYEDYARERIEQLTKICTSQNASIEQIRGAQIGISEMRALESLRETLIERSKREK